MKTIKNLKLASLLFLFVMITISCSDDDETTTSDQFDGSIESIEDFFNSDIIDSLNELGFTFNTGNNPPTIDGEFLASPFILQNSTVIGDVNGHLFNDYLINFFDQNLENLTLNFTSQNGNQSSEGFGSFVSGSNNSFSVFLKANSSLQGQTAKFAYAISGEMTSTGITNFQFANLMLDDNGDPAGVWIENNTGRLIIDSDGFSPKQ